VACLVQDRIGAKNAGAMDVAAGCTGFAYALDTAGGILTMGRKRRRALVIGAEILTRITDWNDRGSCVLFGDGAARRSWKKQMPPAKARSGAASSAPSWARTARG
jgi:3-oxoacyl-[acyl-carrier-protein] synthase-3